VALNQQTSTFLYGNENADHHLGTGFLYIRESYKRLRGLSLLVVGCLI
jgi:hypothetical protein